MTMRYDLHTHTTCSDGVLSPEELILKAKSAGLSGLSITDHDTLSAYTQETFEIAEKAGMQLIVGVELSTFHEHVSVHLLGYNVSLKSPALTQLLTRLQMRRVQRNRSILDKLARCALPISEKELERLGSLQQLGRPHIARIMVEKGYVPTIEKAFTRFLGEGKPCYDAGEIISTQEAVEAVHAAGGKAIIAHPHLLKKRRFVKKLLALPVEGLEGYYGSFRKEEDARWIALAEEHGVAVTGGSDFHGHDSVHAKLGSSWISKEAVDALFCTNDC